MKCPPLPGRGFLHLDLKLGNFLVDNFGTSKQRVTLIDFGGAAPRISPPPAAGQPECFGSPLCWTPGFATPRLMNCTANSGGGLSRDEDLYAVKVIDWYLRFAGCRGPKPPHP